MMNRVNFPHIITLCLAIMMIGSCSPKASRNLLSVIFDGVPSNGQESPDVADSLRVPSLAVNIPATPGDSLPDSTYYHYPYKENYCASCHDENSNSEMILPEPDLCYSCHEDYSNVYPAVHGPAAGGYCTSCHHPHMSDKPKLLNRKGSSLCLHCHDSKMISENPAHADSGEKNCTICHNPHGGDDRRLIR